MFLVSEFLLHFSQNLSSEFHPRTPQTLLLIVIFMSQTPIFEIR
ncbi:Protein CBG25963 [Caenorhabditis briggsae]|uniref:Protein CBG25963 n=1 Tax=Caenorhabditis briggsae TaxID=6238 RepID=B6IKR3_CAEBR|nr:Protein CBG25963 [Caenorhabditis briggsae]CAS00493.1 Protein CBG25963 [Caenorhabditis briggsae]